jgi:hypothetical protein
MKNIWMVLLGVLLFSSCGGGGTGGVIAKPADVKTADVGLGLKWFPNIIKGRIPFDQYVFDITKSPQLKSWKINFMFDQAVFLDQSGKSVTNIDFTYAAYGSSNLLGSMLDLSITEGGKYSILESFALVYMKPRDAKGAELLLKQGTSINISVPVPYGMSDAVIKTLKVYSFDMKTAKWVQESLPEVKNLSGTKVISFKATHITYWMVASPIDKFACIKGQIKCVGIPDDADVLVVACGENYAGLTRTYIKNNGMYELDVKMNSSVTVYAFAADEYQTAGFLVGTKAVEMPGTSKAPEGSGNTKQKVMNIIMQKDGYSAIKSGDDLYQIKSAMQYEKQNTVDPDQDAKMQKEFDEMNKLLEKPKKDKEVK